MLIVYKSGVYGEYLKLEGYMVNFNLSPLRVFGEKIDNNFLGRGWWWPRSSKKQKKRRGREKKRN